MAERNWGLIQSGEVFEALVTAIVFHNDPTTVLLGREGVDGAQDARSGNGRIIYQAKFHKNGTAKLALKDAKAEFSKIEKYRLKDSSRFEQWKDAEEWVLITNQLFNPSDDEEFRKNIVPLFKSIGLKASYWERSRLDIFLDLFVDVHNSYFGQNVRSFLSLGEAKLKLQEELGYMGRKEMPAFVGREVEMEAFDKFLESDSFFFAFHGAGGIGKTRLLYESGLLALKNCKWQVLWANVATMENTSAWFTTIVPERPTLLLIDEPENDKLLRLMMEQVGRKVGRSAGWKVAISVRSHKDPVLRFLLDAKNKDRVEFLNVKALPNASSIEFCENLIRSGKLMTASAEWIRNASRQIADSFSSHPIWISIAVNILERDGDLTQLPTATIELMELYYSEQIAGLSLQEISLINYVALVGVVNAEQNDVVELICRETNFTDIEFRQKMLLLIKRGLVVRRGANQRLYEIKPDVVRDFIVRKWLTASDDNGQLSDDAVQLMDRLIDGILNNKFSIVQRSFLFALVRVEKVLLSNGLKISFLRSIYDAVKYALPRLDSKRRIAVIEILTNIATFSPEYALYLSRTMRKNIADSARSANLFREEYLTQEDVVKTLGWFVYHAAIGAEESKLQKDILIEMLELSIFEADASLISKQPMANDGKRAKSLLDRVLIGGPDYLNDYAIAASMSMDELFKRYEKAENERSVIKDVFNSLVTVRRHQSWFENNSFNTRILFISRDGEAWRVREKIIAWAREIIEKNKNDLALRISLWEVLSAAHAAINQCRIGENTNEFGFEAQLVEDLFWVKKLLETKASLLNFEEICAARKIWHWHVEYEKDSEILSVSQGLEEVYIGTELAGEFDQLFKFDVDYEEQENKRQRKAIELASLNDIAEIIDFIGRAISYLGVERNLHVLDSIAYGVGAVAEGNESISKFMDLYLKDVSNTAFTKFATCIAQQSIRVLLSRDRILGFDALQKIISQCIRQEERAAIIYGSYSMSWRNIESVLPVEYEYVRDSFECFNVANRHADFFSVVGWGVTYDWDGYRLKIYEALMATPFEQRKHCLENLFRCIYGVLRDVQSEVLPTDLNVFVFYLMAHVSESGGDGQDWLVREIFKKTGDVSIIELCPALKFRVEVENSISENKFKAVGYSNRISEYVEKVAETNFESEDFRVALTEVVELMSICKGSLSYYFPDVLNDVDPLGLLVPDILIDKLVLELDNPEEYRFKRSVRAYKVGSDAWRKLARPILERAEQEWPESSERHQLYSLLSDHGVRTWSSVAGEVPQLFIDNVEKSQTQLDSEQEAIFIPFFEWTLHNKKNELDRQIEQAKEERGE